MGKLLFRRARRIKKKNRYESRKKIATKQEINFFLFEYDLIKRHISCFIFSRRKKKFNYNLYMKLHTYYNIIINNHTLI